MAEIKSWGEWFEKRAQYYKDPLSKIAYYLDGKLLPYEVMEATISDVWKKLRANHNCRLLDIGGGPGLFAEAFRPRFKDIVTTDISFTMLKDAIKRNPCGKFFVCGADMLPFESSSFDRLLCYSVFHYFPSFTYAKKAMDEFIRVVKDKGIILIGDIPSAAKMARNPVIKKACKTGAKRPVTYPALLKHNLKYKVFDPKFFIDFCAAKGLSCEVLRQNIEGKPTSANRFDVAIKVRKI